MGLICLKTGFKDHETGVSKLSRIRATEPLIDLFRLIRLELYHVHYPEDRELIILAKVDAQPKTVVKDGLEMIKVQKLRSLVDYEDTDQTNHMRDVLRRYNSLLSDTVIDIPTLEGAFTVLGGCCAAKSSESKYE